MFIFPFLVSGSAFHCYKQEISIKVII